MAAVVLALFVAGAGLFFLSDPLISAVQSVTGGNWGADLALGIGFVLFPLAVSRSGTDGQLDHQVNTQLPGLLGGMGIGVGVLALSVAVLYVWARLRERPR